MYQVKCPVGHTFTAESPRGRVSPGSIGIVLTTPFRVDHPNAHSTDIEIGEERARATACICPICGTIFVPKHEYEFIMESAREEFMMIRDRQRSEKQRGAKNKKSKSR